MREPRNFCAISRPIFVLAKGLIETIAVVSITITTSTTSVVVVAATSETNYHHSLCFFILLMALPEFIGS